MNDVKRKTFAGVALLLAAVVVAAGCGGKTTKQDAGGDAFTDADAVDVTGDGDAVADPVGEDAPVDGVTDQPGDQAGDQPGDAAEDAPGEEVAPPTVQPFETESAGGAVLTSANYKMELFVAPARPVGSTSSASYKMKLGPGGVRSPK